MRHGAFVVFLMIASVCFAADDPKLPYKTIEEAIIASGGTVAVMDTSDPDSAQSAVQAVMDRGLTASDERGLGRERAYAGLQFQGRLVRDHDLQKMTYQGHRGERLRVTVTSSDFVPELRGFLDANGAWGKFDEYHEKGPVAEALIQCPYTGPYEFAVSSRGFNSTGYGAFTLSVKSDKGAATGGKISDGLVTGETYTIRELNTNQSTEERHFKVEAYYVFKRECPSCDPLLPCKMCWDPMMFCDELVKSEANLAGRKDTFAVLRDRSAADYVLGQRYRLKINIRNTSHTNVPQNEFEILSSEKIGF